MFGLSGSTATSIAPVLSFTGASESCQVCPPSIEW